MARAKQTHPWGLCTFASFTPFCHPAHSFVDQIWVQAKMASIEFWITWRNVNSPQLSRSLTKLNQTSNSVSVVWWWSWTWQEERARDSMSFAQTVLDSRRETLRRVVTFQESCHNPGEQNNEFRYFRFHHWQSIIREKSLWGMCIYVIVNMILPPSPVNLWIQLDFDEGFSQVFDLIKIWSGSQSFWDV